MPTQRALYQEEMLSLSPQLQAYAAEEAPLLQRQQRLRDEVDAHEPAASEEAKPRWRARMRVLLQGVAIVLVAFVDVIVLRGALEYWLTAFFPLATARALTWFVPFVIVGLEAYCGYRLGLAQRDLRPRQAVQAAIGPLPAGARRPQPVPLFKVIGLLFVAALTTLVAVASWQANGLSLPALLFLAGVIALAVACHLIVIFGSAAVADELELLGGHSARERLQKELDRVTATLQQLYARRVQPLVTAMLEIQRQTANDPEGPVGIPQPSVAVIAMVERAFGRDLFGGPGPNGGGGGGGGAPPQDEAEEQAPPERAGQREPEMAGVGAGNDDWQDRAERAEAEARAWRTRADGQV